ncbi:MAG: reverse transcriptase/maturase family protein [Candidatus Paceibacterota bacterium]|jgi:retron-type reverse transcriptase
MRNDPITPNSETFFSSQNNAWVDQRKGVGGGGLHSDFNSIISIENLLISWREFLRGKRKRKDVILFSLNLMENIYILHSDLKNKTYKHGDYIAFNISDPKPRNIHKATVRDRLLHHAIYRVLYPYFEKKFVCDSYSCRIGKGTHRAIYRLESFIQKVGKNNTKQCWILKCDIKKFFVNIDHGILKNILAKHIADKDVLWFLEEVIDSFKVGLPLGNLTSQLLVNIYMNEFDKFVKRELKVKYYIRYADDFVILSEDKKYLENILEIMKEFLENNLKLKMHSDKIFIKTIYSGVDFLGWIHFPEHRTLRTSTKNRMFRNFKKNQKPNTIISYFGMLEHGNGFKLKTEIELLMI